MTHSQHSACLDAVGTKQTVISLSVILSKDRIEHLPPQEGELSTGHTAPGPPACPNTHIDGVDSYRKQEASPSSP